MDARVKAMFDECTTEAELEAILSRGSAVAYDGFEPSGRMHIAQGVMKCLSVNALAKRGVTTKLWIADWFAQLNDKVEGDLEAIRTIGDYFVEIWKSLGMDTRHVEFLRCSREISKRPDEYWSLVMDVARKTSLKRTLRCTQIMGRSNADDLTAAQVMYPLMQVADVFFLDVDICQMGMDQRKVNMLAREYAEACVPKRPKPVVLSHAMLPGLLEGREKMSKSDPGSAIFVDDDEATVAAKVKKAFCPPGTSDRNPCLAYLKHIVFPWFGSFTTPDACFETYEETVAAYESGALHPSALKTALAEALNSILKPVRDHFATDERAKSLQDRVRSICSLR